MNEDGSPYPFDPLPGIDSSITLLSSQQIQFARQQDHIHRSSKAQDYRSRFPSLEPEYKLIYHLEVLWNAVKSLITTYAKIFIQPVLSMGVAIGSPAFWTQRIDEDDLEYQDDLIWMGVKTEIGVAGEGIRKILVPAGSTAGAGRGRGRGSGSPPGSSPASSSSAASKSMPPPPLPHGLESGEILLQRLRNGGASDPELRARMTSLISIHDAMLKALSGSWFTEKAVLRGSVYAIIVRAFSRYPVWHEDREFANNFMAVSRGMIDYDR